MSKIVCCLVFSLFLLSVYGSYTSQVLTTDDISSTFSTTVDLNQTLNQYVFSVPYVNSTNFNETLRVYINLDSDTTQSYNTSSEEVTIQTSAGLSTNSNYTNVNLNEAVALNQTSLDALSCSKYNAADNTITYYAFVVLTFTDSLNDNTTHVGIDVQIDYSDSCSSEGLSSSGGDGWIWFLVIGIVVVVVIIVIVAGIAGFLFYKKKNQQQFDLYNDA